MSQGRERQQRTDWIANCGVETMQRRSRDDERYPDPDELGGVPDRVIGVSFWNPFKINHPTSFQHQSPEMGSPSWLLG